MFCLFQALKLDDTDLNLWYKIGLVGMKLVDLNVAISAFQEVRFCVFYLKTWVNMYQQITHLLNNRYLLSIAFCFQNTE